MIAKRIHSFKGTKYNICLPNSLEWMSKKKKTSCKRSQFNFSAVFGRSEGSTNTDIKTSISGSRGNYITLYDEQCLQCSSSESLFDTSTYEIQSRSVLDVLAECLTALCKREAVPPFQLCEYKSDGAHVVSM